MPTYYRTIEVIDGGARHDFFSLFSKEMPQPVGPVTAPIKRPGEKGTMFRKEGESAEPYTLWAEKHYETLDDAVAGIETIKASIEGKLVKVHGMTGRVSDKQMCLKVTPLVHKPIILAVGAPANTHAIGYAKIDLQAME